MVLSSKALPAAVVLQSLRQSIGGVREVSFGKRCVELCGVASAFVQSPKEVLFETFKKSKRAALTDKSMRMSRRLADLSTNVCGAGVRDEDQSSVQVCVRFGRVHRASGCDASVCEASMASKKTGQWRQLSDCVSVVLRDVRKGSEAKAERPVGTRLN